jgi:RNA polymerase sigma factor (sigma-70 family)
LLRDRDRPRESFAVFYRRHVTVVLAFYARRGVQAAQAGDLTAETFAAALVARRRYRAEHESARPWLLTIAARKLLDGHRRLRREERLALRLGLERIELDDRDRADYALLAGHGDAGTDEAGFDGADADGVDPDAFATAALAELPPAQRDAITARIVEERPYDEVGARLGVAEPTARKHVSRGLAALRARLKEDR